jgi:hypothetical protein
LNIGEGGDDKIISPLEGEMSGRTEGGAKDLMFSENAFLSALTP